MKKALYWSKKALFFARNKRLVLDEPFVNIIRSAVTGWLDKGHPYCFDYMAKHLDSEAPWIEIGAYCGLSTCVMSHFRRKYKRSNPLYSIDTWQFEHSKNARYAKASGYDLGALTPFIMEAYQRNVRFFCSDNLPIAVHMSSDDFFEKNEKGEAIRDIMTGDVRSAHIEKISFAYIDGDHSYAYAKRDFLNVDKLLEPGGFILFDDSADYINWGSAKVAREVAALQQYRVIKKNPCYFLQKIES